MATAIQMADLLVMGPASNKDTVHWICSPESALQTAPCSTPSICGVPVQLAALDVMQFGKFKLHNHMNFTNEVPHGLNSRGTLLEEDLAQSSVVEFGHQTLVVEFSRGYSCERIFGREYLRIFN